MSWICPNCDCVSENQSSDHRCHRKDIHGFFEKESTSINDTYLALIKSLYHLGEIHLNIVKHNLIVGSKHTFLIVKPKKQWLDIEFLLAEETYTFPVHKVIPTSQNHYAHYVRIETPSDIDNNLMQMLQSAYELMS